MQTTNTPAALQWLISKSTPMLSSDGAAIPNSGYFRGNLPGRMRMELRDWLNKSGALYRDCGSTVVYNVETADGGRYALTFGAHMSTQNTVKLTFCPDEY